MTENEEPKAEVEKDEPRHVDESHGHVLIDRKTRVRVLWIVVVVWATNFFAGLAIPGYRPDPQIHAVFMIVAGSIFAVDVGKRRGNGDS